MLRILGDCVFPDIGGDSAATGTGDNFFVVWERQLNASDFDIHARMVRADISISQPTIFIENSANTIHSSPHVSQSNGNGFTLTPRWLVAYQFRFSATDEDIYGAVLAQNGTITRPSSIIDNSGFFDAVPSVSSPRTDMPSNDPLFMVTYERLSPQEGRARVLNINFVNQVTPTGLGRFGLGPFWVRAESDGCRFAVIAGDPIGPTTLAMANGTLIRHDAPTALPGAPLYGRIELRGVLAPQGLRRCGSAARRRRDARAWPHRLSIGRRRATRPGQLGGEQFVEQPRPEHQPTQLLEFLDSFDNLRN